MVKSNGQQGEGTLEAAPETDVSSQGRSRGMGSLLFGRVGFRGCVGSLALRSNVVCGWLLVQGSIVGREAQSATGQGSSKGLWLAGNPDMEPLARLEVGSLIGWAPVVRIEWVVASERY